VGEFVRSWRKRRSEENGTGGTETDQGEAPAEHAPAESASDRTVRAGPVDVERARQLTSAALAYAGEGLRVLDRAAAKAHLPFDIA
jgi:hypothetical protein